jgi:CubicO group peptidase (beta-lactamase class C family)
LGGGGLLTTAHDYLRFRLDVARRWRVRAPLPEYGQGFGLGVNVRIEAGRNPNAGSIGDFSWSGISGTYFWVDPLERLTAILMLQAPELRVHYRALLRDLVYGALE